MTTLITGAGLIGASFARHAAERDEAVIFLDPFPRADYLKSMLGDSGYEVVEDDVRHIPALVDILTSNQVDTVVHTAGRIGKRAADPLHEGYSLNIGGTQAVAEAVRLSGVRRLVHISTFGVYDWRRPTPEPVTEDFPRGAGRAYGNFKGAQELILEAYQQTYGFELITLRPANVYGVGHFWAGSSGGEKVQNLIRAGLTGEPASIPQEQTMAFEYVYAKDIGRAVDLAATCALAEKTVFNIANGEVTTFDQLVALARELLPDLSLEIVPGTPPVSRTQHLDISAARDHLGWTPEFTMEEGLEDYIGDMRQAMDAG
jgi:nucleoside-diphosphate-sugar epimerase